MSSPFFSIIIPTKDRPFLLEIAINSVLRQSFEDFEIVIVDNNNNDDTLKVIKEYSDVRIKYFKTGELNMPDNWEVAFDKTQGKYITVLTDRLYYSNSNSLLYIKDALLKTNSGVCSWLTLDCDINSNSTYILKKHSGKYEYVNSLNLLNLFINGDFKYFNRYIGN